MPAISNHYIIEHCKVCMATLKEFNRRAPVLSMCFTAHGQGIFQIVMDGGGESSFGGQCKPVEFSACCMNVNVQTQMCINVYCLAHCIYHVQKS